MSRKVVLITGTNSGFGWLTAHSVAALGHHVYATMRDTQGKNAEKAAALAQVVNSALFSLDLANAGEVLNCLWPGPPFRLTSQPNTL